MSLSSLNVREPYRPAGWDLERTFLSALVTCACLLGFVAWDQSFWWRALDDYRFGWLTLPFVAYAVFRRWDEIRTATYPSAVPAGLDDSPGGAWVRIAMHVGFVGGALLFAFGALARAQAGPSHPCSLALALGGGAMVVALIFLTAPGRLGPPTTVAGVRARLHLTSLFLYPAVVWLVSAPLLSSVEIRLLPFLLHQLVRGVLVVFHVAHLPIALQGSLLVTRGGPVEMATACVGLRSVTGCLFGGLFLGEVYLRRLRWRALLVGAALALALAANFGRVLFLNLWAHKYGADAVEGLVHDASGWAVLGVTAVVLFVLAAWLERVEAPRGG